MQYRTPGCTVTIELSAGQSRSGAAEGGSFHSGATPSLPQSVPEHRGVVSCDGGSIGRSRI